MRHIPSRILTPWGEHGVLDEGPGYKTKILIVDRGQRLSLQVHRLRSERWVVVAGYGVAFVGGIEHPVSVGDFVVVPARATHRLGNRGTSPLVVIEVQLGECEELDIVRLADDYGRTT